MKTNSAPLQRILSLDVFRGLTIVLMILVNSQGNDNAYPILEHAAWNGFTLADMVFPFFLFIVGLTSVISFKKQVTINNKESIYALMTKRSLILFGLGLFINIFPYHFDFGSLRFYGILQRIAVCYFICGIIYLNSSIKIQALLFLIILWGYWFVMTIIPVPGYGANQLTLEGNWVAFFDQMIFSSKHLYAKVYDPEGFLSTIPSIATTLLGMLTGSLLLSSFTPNKKLFIIWGSGVIFLFLGWAWNFSFPINKNLWTSSFVLWSGGAALIVFALCYWIIDILHFQKWAFPLNVFGMNAIFAFTFHVLLLKLQFVFHLPLKNGAVGNVKSAITDYLFGNFSAPDAALLYSLVFLLFNYLVVLCLYRRKIFIRV